MDLSLFDYDLPEHLIAQRPAERRDGSRLLVYNRQGGHVEHRRFSDIVEYIRSDDLLVLNDSKVIHARLIGVKEATGATVEIFLVKSMPDAGGGVVWETLARPAKRLRPGDTVAFAEDFKAEFLERREDGGCLVRFGCAGDFAERLAALGKVPLPPYIRREADTEDELRYQTVYARVPGSVAAPTAGLHFTEDILAALRAKGASTAPVTLHVGLGTFLPVKTEDITEHRMHTEQYFVPEASAQRINRAKAEGRRIVCVGTTSLRTLEGSSAAGRGGEAGTQSLQAGEGSTDIFIYPGYRFRMAGALLTNFHLPKSTLFMLISAFAGREEMLRVYKEAVRESYRFFSYGDAMLIL
ncbi:MAG: tRNA preQ1(34) S-adenosylmethionine ribosyltransferase-isomerase QueA [Clostridiales Family XIII bacterium]|jgi:S-adenosylmethionine:tRNA ribosyltransferase-isomerase|nr:tRNA preQ1(34) S-adenosylmethionine ribosyltransferase-isomerase QueA [Clostridiales Family XIII bacterium]